MSTETPPEEELKPTERIRRFGETAIRTPANLITFVRLLFSIPVLLWILDVDRATWGTFAGWSVLWLTDGLDGWLARRDGTTRSGAFLDPLADKILVLGGFFALAIRGDFAWEPVLIVAGRELFVSAYRSWASRRGVSLPARRLGKWKATIQFFAVALVLCPLTDSLHDTHDAVLWIAAVFSVVSLIDLLAHRTTSNPASEAILPGSERSFTSTKESAVPPTERATETR
jgi:CDP-diacylglycerol--glycerol-3-phosphate 3-phosphatidyltransferase